MKEIFTTRQNLTLEHNSKNKSLKKVAILQSLSDPLPQENSEAILFSAIVGVDNPPFQMKRNQIGSLGDHFTQNIILNKGNPKTLAKLIEEIEAIPQNTALRKIFVVAEGGQFKLADKSFELNARIVFTWQEDNSSHPIFMLSTVPILNSESSLLQLISWSEKDNSFHFFERKHGVWGWAGNSFTSFNPLARGKGPFDSHINGSLVMKELKFPWAHWHSQSSSIPREAFGSNSEFNTNPLFSEINGAEELESIVKNGIRRWTSSRLKTDLIDNVLPNIKTYFRQILIPTSANLISSSIEFSRVAKNDIPLPSSFLYDIDGIEFAASRIDMFSDIIPEDKIIVSGIKYKEIVTDLAMIVESENELTQSLGDTHFSFLVPERAFEDLEVCKQLVEENILSPRLLLSLLMVDFSNPVVSKRRLNLMKYCPDAINIVNGESLDELFVRNILTGEFTEDSSEAEFLKYWHSKDILNLVKTELRLYLSNIQNNLEDRKYIREFILLAERRKNHFRKRKLNEFTSSLSKISNITIPTQMDKNGKII